MKIQNLLNEQMGAAVGWKNLDSLDVGILKKIAGGNTDFDNASQQAQDSLDKLISYGLVDELSLDITQSGQRALDYQAKFGTYGRRQQQQAQSQGQGVTQAHVDDDNGGDWDIDD